MDRDGDVVERLWVIGASFTDANEVGDIVFFEDRKVGCQGCVGGAVEDQEAEGPDLDGADADSRHCESGITVCE